eukprot:jgi/Mesen1/7485/ME000039S06708
MCLERSYTSTITPLQRDMSLQRILQVGGVLMSTYDMVGGHYQALQGRQLDEYDDAGFKAWHYVILDEGHLAKNPKTKRFQGLKALPFAHCLLLTGTPIQNQLKVRPSPTQNPSPCCRHNGLTLEAPARNSNPNPKSARGLPS